MIGMIASAAGSVAGMIGGLMGKRQEAKRRRRMDRWIDSKQQEAKAFYDREANTDMLDTAEGASKMQALRKMLREQNKMVDNSVIQNGGTAESALAAKEQANAALGDGMAQIAALGGQRKDQLRGEYMAQKGNFDSMKFSNQQAAADASGNSASNLLSLGGQSLSAFGQQGGFEKVGGFVKNLFSKKP